MTLLALLLAVGVVGYYLLQSSGGVVAQVLGMKLTAAQIAQYASNAGFTGDDLTTAVAIALAESGGDPNAIGDQTLAPTKGPSQGLMQINVGSKAHPEWNDGQNFDPQINMYRAYELYLARGQAFGDWSTFTSGKYEAFLGQADAGINA